MMGPRFADVPGVIDGYRPTSPAESTTDVVIVVQARSRQRPTIRSPFTRS
jgi:hypothetical protein